MSLTTGEFEKDLSSDWNPLQELGDEDVESDEAGEELVREKEGPFADSGAAHGSEGGENHSVISSGSVQPDEIGCGFDGLNFKSGSAYDFYFPNETPKGGSPLIVIAHGFTLGRRHYK